MTTSGVVTSELTAQEVITLALQAVSVYSAGEQPSAEDSEYCRQVLNWMLKSWQTQGNLWREAEDTVTFPADTATMDLTPTGSGVIDVIEARLVQSSTYHRPLERWESGQYRYIPNKAQSGYPTAYFIDKQVGGVSMTLWPVPSEEFDVIYSYQRIIQDIVALTDTLDVPQQWTEAVWTNLAVRVAPKYGVARLDPTTLQFVAARASELEQQMLDSDRPASIFMGPAFGRQYF